MDIDFDTLQHGDVPDSSSVSLIRKRNRHNTQLPEIQNNNNEETSFIKLKLLNLNVSTPSKSLRSIMTRIRINKCNKRRRLFCAILVVAIILTDIWLNYNKVIYFRLWEYRWERFRKRVWSSKRPPPIAALTTTLAARRDVLNMKYHHTDYNNKIIFSREQFLVQQHLDLLEHDMNIKKSATVTNQNKTVILMWSGRYPVWQAKVQVGIIKNCNIPCEWTIDKNYNLKNKKTKVTALVCMLYGEELCRDISQTSLQAVGINGFNHNRLPVLAITWENNWEGYETQPVNDVDESIPSQLDRLQLHVPYNLIASYELDSHIPVLYEDIANFIDHYTITTFAELIRQQSYKSDSVFYAISNCKAPIRPDRLAFIRDLDSYYPTSSFGKCLGSPHNRKQHWNSRDNRGSNRTFTEMAKHRFVYAAENSYGVDYVTEKVYYALQSNSSVPIYLGAPNINAFLPDRDAVIHVSDFHSPQALGDYLKKLSTNHSFLVEKHLLWRTRPLPERFLQLSKLVDKKSEYGFACKVCNCVQGRIGCPKILPNN